jgi:hypothetical protein
MAKVPLFLIDRPLGGAEWLSERREVMFAKTHHDTSMRGDSEQDCSQWSTNGQG